MRSFPIWKRVADWMARASGEMALCLSLVGGIRSAIVSWSTIKRSMAGTGTINSPIVNGDVRKPRLSSDLNQGGTGFKGAALTRVYFDD